MAQLPVRGVRLEAQNADKAQKALDNFHDELERGDRRLDQYSTSARKAERASDRLTRSMRGRSVQRMGAALTGVTDAIAPIAPQADMASQGLMSIGAASKALLNPVGLATAAVLGLTAAAAGVGFLGVRGARLMPQVKAFESLSVELGDMNTVLQDLKSQTRGYVSDMHLMEMANFAYVNSSDELQEILQAQGTSLGESLRNMQRLSQALGKDATQSQMRYIEAIKKGERELLDEFGIIVGMEEAVRKYAEANDLAASSLSEQQRQAAFAAEANRQLASAVENLGAGSMILQSLNAPLVAFQNVLDRVSLAAVPAIRPAVMMIGDMARGFEQLAQFVMPLVATAFERIGAVVNAAGIALRKVVNAFRLLEVVPYLVAAVQIATDAMWQTVRFVANNFASAINLIIKPFAALAGFVNSALGNVVDTSRMNIEALMFLFAQGGGRVIGGFLKGFVDGGVAVIQAAAKIAEGIADFLVGLSPPKKGALKDIDKGGRNVAMAWLDGFRQGILDNISYTTQEINNELGAIGKFTEQKLEQRFKQLDKALLPFQENLDLVKADMEAIAGFVDPAMDAIERQRQQLLDQFQDGGVGAEQIRALDRQIAELRAAKREEQDRLDNAKIAMAIAEASQAQERARLRIQERRLDVLAEESAQQKNVADAITNTSKAASASSKRQAKDDKKASEKKKKKKKRSGGGSGEPVQQPAGGGAASGLAGGGVLEGMLSSPAVEKARATLEAGFQAGIEQSGLTASLSRLDAARGELSTQTSRIAEADPVESIREKFENIPTAIGDELGKIPQKVTNALTGLDLSALTDPFNTAVTDVTTELLKIPTQLGTLVVGTGIGGITTALAGLPGKLTTSLLAPFENVGSDVVSELKTIPDELGGIPDTISEKLAGLESTLQTVLQDPFETVIGFIEDRINDLFSLIAPLANLELPELSVSGAQEFISNFIGGNSDDSASAGGGFADMAGRVSEMNLLKETITQVETGLIGLEEKMATMKDKLSEFKTSILTPFNELKVLFAEGGAFGAEGVFQQQITTLFGEQSLLMQAMGDSGISEKVRTTFTTINQTIRQNLLLIERHMTLFDNKITSMFISSTGLFALLVQTTNDAMTDMRTRIATFVTSGVPSAFGGITSSLHRAFVVPVINAANRVLAAIENAVNVAYSSVPGGILEMLRAEGYRIPLNLPRITAAAQGAIGHRGMTLVGEQGPELVNFTRAANIFPADVSRAIMAQSTPRFRQGNTTNNTTNNNQRSQTNNFNMNNPRQARLTARQMRAAF